MLKNLIRQLAWKDHDGFVGPRSFLPVALFLVAVHFWAWSLQSDIVTATATMVTPQGQLTRLATVLRLVGYGLFLLGVLTQLSLAFGLARRLTDAGYSYWFAPLIAFPIFGTYAWIDSILMPFFTLLVALWPSATPPKNRRLKAHSVDYNFPLGSGENQQQDAYDTDDSVLDSHLSGAHKQRKKKHKGKRHK